jgi:hypothetical protein
MRHIYGEVTAKNTDSSYSHQFGSTFSPSKGKEDKGINSLKTFSSSLPIKQNKSTILIVKTMLLTI